MSRSKLAIGAALVAIMLFGAVAVSYAAPVLTLTPTRSVVTYPAPSWLKLTATENGSATATTVTIQYRPAGSDTWVKLRTVSANRTGEGTVTVPIAPYRLKSNTGFRAIAGAVESEVATVSVKAKLSKPSLRKKARVGQKVVVQGHIWPRHAVGSRPVTITIWKYEGGDWVQKAAIHPKVTGKKGDSSKWRFVTRATTASKGKWRLQVSHEDAKHVASTSKFSYITVR